MVPFDLRRRAYGVDAAANIRAGGGFLYSTNVAHEEMIHPLSVCGDTALYGNPDYERGLPRPVRE